MSWKLTDGFGLECFQLTYEAAKPWVHAHWSGPPSYLRILHAGETILRALPARPCPGLLHDCRAVAAPFDQPYEWLLSDWAPRAAAAVLTRIAHVVSEPELVSGEAASAHLVLAGQLQVRLFVALEQAQAWLREAPTTRFFSPGERPTACSFSLR
jgi:hypothetical protein